MKKRVTYLLAAAMTLVTVSLFLGGCDSSNSSDSIKIGANLELTGTNASFGNSAKNGIDLAVKEINDNGGVFHRKLEVVTADNRSDTADAVSAMQKLVDQKVLAIIGPMTSSGMIASAGINSDAKIMAITPSASNPAVTIDPARNKVRPYVFRATFIDPFQGRLMADFAVKDLHATKAAVLVDSSNEYSKGLGEFFSTQFEKLGGKVVAREAYLQKDNDFRAILTTIKATNPDIIFIPGYYQEIGMIIKQARSLDINVPIIGGDGWDSSKLAEIAGPENLKNTYYSTHYSPQDTTKSVVEFIAKYKAAYNTMPDSFAVLSYESVYMIKAAIEQAGITDSEKIATAMSTLKTLTSVTGEIKIDQDHNVVSPGIIMTFDAAGNPVFYSRVSP